MSVVHSGGCSQRVDNGEKCYVYKKDTVLKVMLWRLSIKTNVYSEDAKLRITNKLSCHHYIDALSMIVLYVFIYK